MKKYLLLLVLLTSFSGFAQNTINNYKYVLVPQKFSFLKQENQYDLNQILKALLEQKGFTTYFNDETIPDAVASNKCLALIAEVTEKKTMFTTNLTIFLKDCKGNVVYQTKQGTSREKEYRISYNLALRDAFTSFDEITYAYSAPAASTNEEGVITPKYTPAPQAPSKAAVAVAAKQAEGTLYAQPVANGYQLIDTAPKIILTLLKTSTPDYFIATNGTQNGLVLKKNGDWFFEYYQNDQLVAQKLLIKF